MLSSSHMVPSRDICTCSVLPHLTPDTAAAQRSSCSHTDVSERIQHALKYLNVLPCSGSDLCMVRDPFLFLILEIARGFCLCSARPSLHMLRSHPQVIDGLRVANVKVCRRGLAAHPDFWLLQMGRAAGPAMRVAHWASSWAREASRGPAPICSQNPTIAAPSNSRRAVRSCFS